MYLCSNLNSNVMVDRLKAIMRQKGVTQVELSEKLGITKSAFYQRINGNPSLSSIKELADALGVEVWELFIDREDIIKNEGIGNDKPEMTIVCPHCGKPIKITIDKLS